MHPRNTSLVPFFLISMAFHLLFLLAWPKGAERERILEQIPVAFLPSPEEKRAESIRTPKEPSTRPSKIPVEIARKSTPFREEETKGPVEISKEEQKRPEIGDPKPQARDKDIIVRRPLPTLKELLPPVTWSASGQQSADREGPVKLDTREPRYISYFTSIKRAIELVWEYPEPALRHGLQGKLMLEFTILGNGHLDGTRLIRSSGVSVLDQEAIRAVQAASPFQPIPPWIGKARLDIIASFEYLDNRLRYRFAQ